MSNPRPYDVVLYGASGFTGRQTVEYFANRVGKQVRWAIAGRNRQKLEQVKASYAVEIDIWVADSQDQEKLDTIAESTHVLLNTAGPFALYGDGIVDACVRKQTHYVDITGETPWVKALIQRYHAKAVADGTRIIPFCGFDSVPSDLGTYLLVRFMQRELGVSCRQVKAYFQAAGGFTGGTLASAINLIQSGQSAQMADPFLLNPQEESPPTVSLHNQDPQRPQYDKDIKAWTAPFFMSPVNTRVVRRSCALFEQWHESYGPQFAYQEYLKFDGPLASLAALGVTLGTGLFALALSQSWTRTLLQSRLPQPGSGPSTPVMDEGWFRCELIGQTTNGQKVHGLIQNQGDPGNRSTVKFLCESALCLATQAEQVPGKHRGGVLTPATGLGDVLADRLRQAGTSIEIGVL